MNELKDVDSFKQLKPLNTRETRLEAGIDTWCHSSDVDNVVHDDDVVSPLLWLRLLKIVTVREGLENEVLISCLTAGAF